MKDGCTGSEVCRTGAARRRHLWRLAGIALIIGAAALGIRLVSGPGCKSAELLILVNPWNPIPSNYSPELVSLGDGHEIDARCCEDLEDMLSACRGDGYEPYICSAYRTSEMQLSLYEDKVSRLMASGLDLSAARTEAARVVAIPGTSEHQLGLAVDIVDLSYTALDEGQEDTAVQQWLMQNSYRYGFILRYPNGKSDVTGIIYEPWHYRYVGKQAASEIYRSGQCLEEYLQKK
jgi:D-alanyl-D-alanine carboxypeptidase